MTSIKIIFLFRNDFDEDFSHLLDQPSSNNENGGARYMSPQRRPQPPQRSISENNSTITTPTQSPQRQQNAFKTKSNSYDGRRTSNANHLDDIDDDFPSLVSGSKSGIKVGIDEFPSPGPKSGSKEGADALWDSTGTGSLGAEEEAEEQEVSMRFEEDPDGMAMQYPDRYVVLQLIPQYSRVRNSIFFRNPRYFDPWLRIDKFEH